MDRAQLLKELEKPLDEFEKNQTFGSIEICFNRGKAEVIRVLTSKKYFSDKGSIPNGHRIENR
jgi:hypothetical protein